MGIEPEFIGGLRKTDAAMMEIAEMALGKINKSLVQYVEELGVDLSDGSLYTPSMSVKNASFSASTARAIAHAASSALMLYV